MKKTKQKKIGRKEPDRTCYNCHHWSYVGGWEGYCSHWPERRFHAEDSCPKWRLEFPLTPEQRFRAAFG
jgi:hypothetical protein